jgi:hypothetical protein
VSSRLSTARILITQMTSGLDGRQMTRHASPRRPVKLSAPVQTSGRFEPSLGPATLCAFAAEIGPDGLTKAIAPVRIGGLLSPAEPCFWS